MQERFKEEGVPTSDENVDVAADDDLAAVEDEEEAYVESSEAFPRRVSEGNMQPL